MLTSTGIADLAHTLDVSHMGKAHTLKQPFQKVTSYPLRCLVGFVKQSYNN